MSDTDEILKLKQRIQALEFLLIHTLGLSLSRKSERANLADIFKMTSEMGLDMGAFEDGVPELVANHVDGARALHENYRQTSDIKNTYLLLHQMKPNKR